MASNEPIDRLFVKLEADTSELLKKGEGAIQRLEKGMEDLDRKAKKVGRFEKFKQGLDSLIRGIRAAQAALLAFGAAFVTAFRLAQQAVTDLRIEKSFFRLASVAQQSGEEIMASMRHASKNMVSDLELMRLANAAMQLQVAKTPEEFEKLTRSAIRLGAALGKGPTEALEELVTASGRRAVEILDNLGLGLGEVNALMDQFAQQDFGKPVDQLTQVQRNVLFARATLEAADRKAEQLGDTLSGVGTEMEALTAQSENFRSELGQTSLVLFGLLNQMGNGPGLLSRLTEGAKAWQRILIVVSAVMMTINDQLTQAFGKTKRLTELFQQGLAASVGDFFFQAGKRLAEGEPLFAQAGEEGGKSFVDNLTENLQDLEERFQDIIDPEAAAGDIPGPTIDPDPTDESAQEIRDILDDLATDLLNEQDDTDRALEELAEDHAERMADIAEDGAKRRLEIEQDYQRDLADLAEETADRRAEIFEDTQRDLAELQRDTDRALSDEREDFQTEERRDTEDHLREMRRLTEQYLFDLEDAVKERDARAVVDLQRRFAMEQAQREEDFTVTQGREREDFDQRLAEIRENEALRREEILRAQAEELADLMQHEQERRAEIEASRQEQLARLDEQLAEARAKEQENYAERQADLQNALMERLRTIAKELADEENINEQGARAILSTLANYFGVGGEIDQLMDDFQRRATQRMNIEVRFETAAQTPQESLGTTLPPIPRFQHGGQMIARRPTLAMFGEAGPEVAQFTPLNQMGGGGRPQRIQLEFMGSAPPGIRSTERDQIANVLLNALRDTGALAR